VGAARIITLRCPDGTYDGFVLELRRMPDGALSVRIFQPGQRAGLGSSASSSIAAFAGALAKKRELKLNVHVAHYSFQRDHDWVRVELFDYETDSKQNWLAPTSVVLDALSEIGNRAA
jgi:hypothetical protein